MDQKTMPYKSMITRFFMLVLALGSFPVSSPAQVRKVVVEVKGMSCPFCAFGVEKKLNAVNGVDTVEVDMASSHAVISAGEGKSLSLDDVRRAVKEAGFTPGALILTVMGTLEFTSGKTGKTWTLRMHTEGPPFLLSFGEEKKEKTEALQKQMIAWEKDKETVEIKGIVHVEKEGKGEKKIILIESIRLLPKKGKTNSVERAKK